MCRLPRLSILVQQVPSETRASTPSSLSMSRPPFTPDGQGSCQPLLNQLVTLPCRSTARYMLTSLLIPSRVPAARAQRSVGKPELHQIFSFHASPRLREGGKPDGTGQSPRPWPERTCGSRRSFASSAWSGWCWGNGRRHLGSEVRNMVRERRVCVVASRLLVHRWPSSATPSAPSAPSFSSFARDNGSGSSEWALQRSMGDLWHTSCR